MLSFIVGCAIGYWVSRTRAGLVSVVAYGAVVGFILAKTSHHEGAGLFPIVLALVGFAMVRCCRWLRRAIGSGSPKGTVHPTAADGKSASERASLPDPNAITGAHDELFVAAGLAHSAYLNAVGRELDDVEFAAAALGAFDGAVQALGLRWTDNEMHTRGTTFALQRLSDLERMQGASPGELGTVVGRAMFSPNLEKLRTEAGELAYMLSCSMPQSGSLAES